MGLRLEKIVSLGVNGGLCMKYYVIEYENGAYRHGEFNSYIDALNYAKSHCGGWAFTIEVYESEEDYLMNL